MEAGSVQEAEVQETKEPVEAQAEAQPEVQAEATVEQAEVQAEVQPEQQVEVQAEAEPVDPYADLVYPCVALVTKYGDAIPVQVKDRTHLNQLIADHGGVRIQS